MNYKKLFLYAGVSTTLVACGGKGTEEKTDEKQQKETTQKELNTIEVSAMDTTISPREDFYEYCVGNWRANNPVPSTEGRWGSFNELEDRNNTALKEILESAAANEDAKDGSIEQLIGDFYYTLMDSTTRNELGISPIQPWLDKIAALDSKEGMTDLLVELHKYGIGVGFDAGVEQDLKDNSKHALYIGQSGIGLPDRDYYSLPQFAEVKEKYKGYIQNIMTLAGAENTDQIVADVMKIEEAFASASMNSQEQRNIQAQYNKMSMEDLQAMNSSFDWAGYFEGRGYGTIDTVIVAQPAFVQKFEEVMNSASIDAWKNYLTFRTISSASSALSDDFVQANFDFYSTELRGMKEMKPRWKRAIRTMTRTAINEALGHAFVDKHFSQASKDKVNEMVDNLMAAFKDRLEVIDWMSPETKEKAKLKLASFGRKLGFPDEWKDYSDLKLDRSSYASNYFACKAFSIAENTNKLGEPIDKKEWGMPPHMINAYYNPLLNEIAFPAGIMQPPFFDPEAEDAVNYGRMGMVIGHEFTHGFDDQGAQFDHTGLLKNWWTEEDLTEFSGRTAKLVEQYNSFSPIEGVNVNGNLTLGENIADLGGTTLAYYAYMKSLEGKEKKVINGFTPEQRFFIAMGQIWKINYTDPFVTQMVATNPHSPGKYRVNGPLSNMPEFFEAFGVEEGDPMRMPEDKIAKIW